MGWGSSNLQLLKLVNNVLRGFAQFSTQDELNQYTFNLHHFHIHVYRGYYTAAQKYEFFFRVVRYFMLALSPFTRTCRDATTQA